MAKTPECSPPSARSASSPNTIWRMFHVHYKPLYEAIGEGNNRNRRPATLGRMIERLMILDAVPADRRHTWLGTERDKVAYFKEFLHKPFGLEDVPQITYGEGAAK